MSIAVLSNINMDPLKARFDQEGLFKDYYFSLYGQYLVDLKNEGSPVYTRQDIKYLFLHLDGEEFLKDAVYSCKDQNQISRDIEDLLLSVEIFVKSRPEVTVIISTLAMPPFSVFTYLQEGAPFPELENVFNTAITDFGKKFRNVLVFDFKRIVSVHGYNSVYDEKYWYLGRIKYGDLGFNEINRGLCQLITAQCGSVKKVLVLDLDNTLWGGVIGEDGVNGISLSEEGIGKAYRDLQECIKALKETGILLAINSRNNEAEVHELFASKAMILQDNDFIIKKINWNNKVQNMKEIAAELNLGLDSFVFIDDDPAERLLIRTQLPEVEVADFSEDVSLLKRWFLSEVVYQYFPRIYLTTEDKDKAGQYERQFKRAETRKASSWTDFIHSLEIKVQLVEDPYNNRSRIAQLTQKTNQFNLTAKKYTEGDIVHLINDKSSRVYALEYEDRFGYEGIGGVAIVRIEASKAIMDTYLLSCRILGRNIEKSFLEMVLSDLEKLGVNSIQADYIPTAKNMMSGRFYAGCGFRETAPNRFEGQIKEIIPFLSKEILHES